MREGPERFRAPAQIRDASVLDQANVARAWALRGFLDLELHSLPFAKKFEHRTSDGAAMEEVLDTGFVADEPETFIDQKPSDGTRRHTRILRRTAPQVYPGGNKL